MFKVEQNMGKVIALNLTSKFSETTPVWTLFHNQLKSLKQIINLKVLIKKPKNHIRAIQNQINKPSVHSPKTLSNPSFPTATTGKEEALSPFLPGTLKNRFKIMQKNNSIKLISFLSRKIQILKITKKLSQFPKDQHPAPLPLKSSVNYSKNNKNNTKSNQLSVNNYFDICPHYNRQRPSQGQKS
jgi:hypothetical protein